MCSSHLCHLYRDQRKLILRQAQDDRIKDKLSCSTKLIKQGPVRLGKLVIHQVGGNDPAEVGDFELLRLAAENAHIEKIESDVAIGIRMDEVVDFRADFRFDADFLAQFAVQGGLEFLTRFDFAARKFPVAAEGIIGEALGNEKLTVVAPDHARDDIDRWVG